MSTADFIGLKPTPIVVEGVVFTLSAGKLEVY